MNVNTKLWRLLRKLRNERAVAVSKRLQAVLFLSLLAVSLRADEVAPISHWIFDAEHMQGPIARSVEGLKVTFKGTKLVEQDGLTALDFNGRDCGGLIAKQLASVPLPKKDLTVTAWVRVNVPQTWGGILSCVQDNGDFERGFVLGYLNSEFSIALVSQGHKALTYLKGATSFQPGYWYHVAATYDGATLKLFVNGKLENSSREQSGDIFYPASTFYGIGAYHDDDEYYPFSGRMHEIRLYDVALSEEVVREQYEKSKSVFPVPRPPAPPLPIALGPFVDWVDRNTIQVSWDTAEATPSVVEFGLEKAAGQRFEDTAVQQHHTLVIPGIVPGANYTYWIMGKTKEGTAARSAMFSFDSTFFYEPPPVPNVPASYPNDSWGQDCARLAERVLRETGLRDGYCLILGAEDGRLAYELVKRSRLKVVMVEDQANRVEQARRALDRAGVYGVRVSVHQGSFESLPYGPYFANLVLSERMLRTGRKPTVSVQNVLRPSGGVAWFGRWEKSSDLTTNALAAWLAPTGLAATEYRNDDGVWAIVRRGALAGGGSWTHQYGAPDNSACSQDALVSGELQVAWWGEPGPRPMPDRGNRNPAPLSVNGHLFVQGNRLLFGIDAYNGAIRWTKSVPGTRRANMPRDCSNMAASPDHLYVAQGGYCYGLEAMSGALDRKFQVPSADETVSADWGYLAVVDNLILGSGEQAGAAYLGDDGEWFEDFKPGDIAKVSSGFLFALDRQTGERQWVYRRGMIVNSTITEGDGAVYFVESRDKQALESQRGRLVDEVRREQWVVALDLKTGRVIWERKQDFSACQFTLYLSYAKKTLIAMGTDQSKTYHVFAMETGQVPPVQADQKPVVDLAGAMLWEQHFRADRDHHSGHLQRPVIVGDVLYTDKKAFALRSGTLLRSDLPERRGCGTMSASLGSLFYRHHFHGQWDLNTDKRIQFEGIRSGCWLSLISAGGLMLAPETSAGCSCTHAIQTSVAYVPKALAAKP